MTRAKRIEEAARALLNTHPDDPETHAARAALRSALALPEEESEVGWIVREVGGSGLLRDITAFRAGAESYRDWLNRRNGPRVEIVRVRITVEGEESER